MNNIHSLARRTLTVGFATVALVQLGGCVTHPLHSANPDGIYCHGSGRSYLRTQTCTPGPVPSAEVDAEAKRFEGTADALTVFVLRRSWGDASVVVPVTVQGAADAPTVPESLVRMRLAPGKHKLSAKWDGRTADFEVEGKAGDVRVLELNGMGWAWGNTFKWQAVRLDEVRDRLLATRLVADVRQVR
ncbi:hypothetical protein [Ideonella sp. A 288]|uniref:hypothetical protein n=1 Tax=Ideonella sp. A 288 TaxID=1962181 RepID=UPI0011849CED|nr:hypothetical protein [Ideonella sp. A 288]